MAERKDALAALKADDVPPYTIDVTRQPGPDWTHTVAVEVIERFRKMQDGWDSYGGVKPTEAAIDAARHMAIVPTTHGGLNFEWHTGGWDVEIEVGPDGTIDNVWVAKTDVTIGGDVS